MKLEWQYNISFEAVVFDCDGTLSRIDGMNALAKMNNVEAEINAMRENAMEKNGLTLDIYTECLNKMKPTNEQISTLAERYCEHITPFANTIIQDLQLLGKSVYMISTGLLPAVQYFGHYLGIPPENIFAVDIVFDEKTGYYQDFDKDSLLTTANGKALLLKKLRKQHRSLALIGNSMNNASLAHTIDRLIGFGGSVHPPHIREHSHFYITTCSLLPALPLCIKEEETLGISPVDSDYKQALKTFLRGDVQLGGLMQTTR